MIYSGTTFLEGISAGGSTNGDAGGGSIRLQTSNLDLLTDYRADGWGAPTRIGGGGGSVLILDSSSQNQITCDDVASNTSQKSAVVCNN